MSEQKSLAQLQAEGLLKPRDQWGSKGQAAMTEPKRAEPAGNEHAARLREAADVVFEDGMTRIASRMRNAAAEIERLAARVAELEDRMGMNLPAEAPGPDPEPLF